MYENAYGLSRRNATTYYVSSGLGIWGGKRIFRIGTQSEYGCCTLSNRWTAYRTTFLVCRSVLSIVSIGCSFLLYILLLLSGIFPSRVTSGYRIAIIGDVNE